MFLSFFVIALALAAFYQNTFKKDGESVDYSYETHMNAILSALDIKDAQGQVKTYDPYDSKGDAKNRQKRPVMASLLCEAAGAMQKKGWWLPGASKKQPAEAGENYEVALSHVGQGMLEELGDTKIPPLGMLDLVAAEVRKLKNLEGGGGRTPEELLAEIARLEGVIASQKKEIERLNKIINSKGGAEARLMEEVKTLKAEVARLEGEVAKLRKQMAEMEKKHGEAIAGYEGRIKELEDRLKQDSRPVLMDMLQKKLLQKDARGNYVFELGKRLGEKGVRIERSEGVLRIPSSLVSFPSARMIPEKGDDVLRELAVFLKAVADDNSNARNGQAYNLIDNIVIECHCDMNTFEDKLFNGRAESEEMDGNEILSSKRSLVVWKIMNNARPLSACKNAKGRGLFAHAGFGARVLLDGCPFNQQEVAANQERLRTLKKGEVEDAQKEEEALQPYIDKMEPYHARCRRIDIRFNCTPAVAPSEKAADTKSKKPRVADKYS